MDKQKARVWIYCRNLESVQNSKQKVKENISSWPVSENFINESNGIVTAFQEFCSYVTLTKHWAVVVENLNEGWRPVHLLTLLFQPSRLFILMASVKHCPITFLISTIVSKMSLKKLLDMCYERKICTLVHPQTTRVNKTIRSLAMHIILLC